MEGPAPLLTFGIELNTRTLSLGSHWTDGLPLSPTLQSPGRKIHTQHPSAATPGWEFALHVSGHALREGLANSRSLLANTKNSWAKLGASVRLPVRADLTWGWIVLKGWSGLPIHQLVSSVAKTFLPFALGRI